MPRPVVPRVPALADALRHVEMTGVFYCPAYLTEPWGLTLPTMPDCVWFHAVTTGRATLVAGDRCVELVAGDLALVPHGAGHRMTGTEPAEVPPVLELPHETLGDDYAILRHGGGGPLTELVCGGLRLDHPVARRIIGALPPVIRLDAARSRRSTWTTATLGLLADEMEHRSLGSEAVIRRLCDIVVLHAIRTWVEADGGAGSPWLTALHDAQIGPALAAMHDRPEVGWTVSSLAREACMSRAAFAARFTALLGRPAIAYLTEHRMQLATDLLARTDESITTIAARVGYESEASFRRAFSRVTGTSPRRVTRLDDRRAAPGSRRVR